MNINPKKERNLIHEKNVVSFIRSYTFAKHFCRCRFAEDANSVPVAKESNLTSLLEYHEQEPNDSFEQANYYFITDAVIGTLGEKVQGTFENYDVYKIMASRSNEIQFTIQGDSYPDSWLELTLYDSNSQKIKRSRNGQYF